MNYLKTTLIVAIAICCAASSAAAQDVVEQAPPAKIGRLRDGRAFRVDAHGVRLVDQLAELEVTVDDLERQVSALQGELDERRKSCAENRGEIAEQSLLAPGAGQQTAGNAQPLPERTTYCRELTAPLQAQTVRLEEQLNLERSAADAECRRLVAEASGHSRDAAAAMEALAHEKAANEARLIKHIAELEETLSNSRQKAHASARQERTGPALPDVSTASTRPPVDPSPAAAHNLKSRLPQIQRLINERKDLLDSVRSSRRGVSVEIRPLVTADGISLDSVRARVGRVMTETEAEQAGQALNDIERLLREDIQLLRRLAKL